MKFTRLLHPLLASVIVGVVFMPSAAFSETITVPIGEQGKNKQVERPRAGMLKAQVEASFGQPLETTTGIGEPPISSWRYADFVVYFEHDHVVHSVLRHTPQADAGTESTAAAGE